MLVHQNNIGGFLIDGSTAQKMVFDFAAVDYTGTGCSWI